MIREAAALGGTMDRQTVYDLCGYDDERMLRGFTRPTARVTAELQRAGIAADSVAPALSADLPGRRAGRRLPHPGRDGGDRRRSGGPVDERDPGPTSGKYGPLTDWLRLQSRDSIPVTFAELEGVIGSPLAPSARTSVRYWYSVRNSLGAALAAGGFKASRVNLAAETTTLVRRVSDGWRSA